MKYPLTRVSQYGASLILSRKEEERPFPIPTLRFFGHPSGGKMGQKDSLQNDRLDYFFVIPVPQQSSG